MSKRKKIEIDSKIQEKLDYIGLDLNNLPKTLTEYTDISFRTLKGYDEKKYKQYRFIKISDIEILLTPANRVETIKEKYEKALPLICYLDNKSEENVLNYTTFLTMLKEVSIPQLKAIEEEQKNLSKKIPFKIKFTGSYLWQIYYSETSNKYFMLVPTEDSNYSAFFYLLKKKIEDNKNERIFVPVSCIDYEGNVLGKTEIKDLENYLWLFTKEYPSIYEVYSKTEDVVLNIIGEATIYDNTKTFYKIALSNTKDAMKFYKLVKALFILQTEIPYYNFSVNINEQGSLEFYLDDVKIKYEILPEFIVEQYLKSISLKNKAENTLDELNIKLKKLQLESEELEKEYVAKEKQITIYLECKKTFFGKVKYYFKLGKNTKMVTSKKKRRRERDGLEEKTKHKSKKFKMEERNYTLYELEESFKEYERQEEEIKNLIMDINALKLKNKNLKKKIENATNYIEEINKHKKSIFEFWKYSNKDAVATLDEGEEEELNVKKLEKIFDFGNDFEKFGIESDKNQRNVLTDSELDSAYIATTSLLPIINKINLKTAENQEISDELKKLKLSREKSEDSEEDDDDSFNIFGRIKQANNKERTLGNKVHREVPRDKFSILEISKETKGINLKRKLEEILKNIKSALQKNTLEEDMYVYKISSDKIELNTIENVALDPEKELDKFLKHDKTNRKIYLYKIKLPKGTNYIAFSNIIYFDNKNMTLPTGMELSTEILVDLSTIELKVNNTKKINKLLFEEDEDDFSKIIIKNIEINELS